MTMLYCAELNNDEITFRTAAGDPATCPPPRAPILISRLDCDVRVLHIPPVSQRDVPAFLRYQLRTLYPGNPADTVFDYTTSGEGEKRRATVYLMKRGIMERYRQRANNGRLLSADQLLKSVVPDRKNGAVVLVRAGYVEYLRYADDALVESSVLPLNGRLDLPAAFRRLHGPFPPASADSGAAAGEVSLVWVAERLDDPRIKAGRAATNEEQTTSVISFEDAVGRAHANGWRLNHDALFRTHRTKTIRLAPLVSAFLTASILCLGVLYVSRTIGVYERRCVQVRSEYAQLQSMRSQTAAQEKALLAVNEQYDRLIARRPLNVYAFLSNLAATAGSTRDGARISVRSITVNGSFFTMEGSASDPFSLAAAIASRSGFSGVKIMQAVPVKDGTSMQFTLTGRYHD